MVTTFSSPRGLRALFGLKTVPFWLVHLAALAGVAWLGLSWSGLLLAVGLYYARMWFITAGYHRYFSHRSFKTSRPVQFLLAFGAQTSTQKGVMWWASHHRRHHRHSDQPEDVHSMVHDGFLWSHMGWFLSSEYETTDLRMVPDLARHRELRLLEKMPLLPAVVYAVLCLVFGGMHGFVWGFLVSTVLLWHGTFTINSLSHWIGRQRYETGDASRNSLLLALLTLGEGWHNNHHHYPASSAQGFFWWEIDLTQYVIRFLGLLGVVWDIRAAPVHVVSGRPGERVDRKAA